MDIFVTGATGSVGSILVKRLLDSNHNVTIITRDISHVTNDWRDHVNIVEGNPSEVGSWTNEMLRNDAIINLVGENVFDKRWTDEQKSRIYDSRVLSTKNIVNSIKESDNPPKVLVNVSGTDYYPSSKEKEFTEDDNPGDSFLSKLTQDWEEPVKNLDNENVRTVIFRMGVAFTYSGRGAERMFIPHKFFMGGWIGSGKQIYSWIHIEDFVGLLKWGVENEAVEGIYNGVAPDYKTMKEIAVIGGKIMGRWTWSWAPGFVLKIILGERAKILLEGRPISSEKVQEEGYQFKYPSTQEMLQDILEDF